MKFMLVVVATATSVPCGSSPVRNLPLKIYWCYFECTAGV